MFVFDLTNLLTLFLVLTATILFIYLSQEIKNSKVAAIPLIAFVIDLIIHTIQILTLQEQYEFLYSKLSWNMLIDCVFVLLTFLAYLWADEVDAKEHHKKVLNGKGIEWLWKKI